MTRQQLLHESCYRQHVQRRAQEKREHNSAMQRLGYNNTRPRFPSADFVAHIFLMRLLCKAPYVPHELRKNQRCGNSLKRVILELMTVKAAKWLHLFNLGGPFPTFLYIQKIFLQKIRLVFFKSINEIFCRIDGKIENCRELVRIATTLETPLLSFMCDPYRCGSHPNDALGYENLQDSYVSCAYIPQKITSFKNSKKLCRSD